MPTKYEPVIGLEVHAQMLTKSKAFCGCSTAVGAAPNSCVCPVCLGHPGALPVLNRSLVEYIVLMGIATNCHIRERSTFARKNYFYPDLPKGYQITQYDDPICHDGWIEIELPDGPRKRVGITRIHMEEDAGKSIHDAGAETLVDLNRCGVPLIEIVSEPEISSPAGAYAYLTQIKRVVTYLGICDGNMEEGSLRCDANVSVRPKGSAAFGTKTELKNLNSFRNVERAIAFEIDRQVGLLEAGDRVIQETLLWDAARNAAAPMRSKEEAHDYRYFPEPDLVPVHVTEEWRAEIALRVPELPLDRRDRLVRDYDLPRYDADILANEKPLADFFERTVSALEVRDAGTCKTAANWILGDFLRLIREGKHRLAEPPVPAERLAELLNLLHAERINGKMAKEIFERMFAGGESAAEIVEIEGMSQVTDADAIGEMLDRILAGNPDNIRKYFAGREQVFGFFVGQVMKETGGQANPKLVNEILRSKLNALRGAEGHAS